MKTRFKPFKRKKKCNICLKCRHKVVNKTSSSVPVTLITLHTNPVVTAETAPLQVVMETCQGRSMVAVSVRVPNGERGWVREILGPGAESHSGRGKEINEPITVKETLREMMGCERRAAELSTKTKELSNKLC